MKKRLLNILTALIMVVSLAAVNVNAAGTSIKTLEAKYPTGSRWTSSYDKATQCHGWALMIADKAYGYSSTSKNRCRNRKRVYDVNSIKAGDVVRVYRSSAHSDSKAHTIFITAVSGSNITFADCNWDKKCGIRWGTIKTKNSFLNGTFGYGLQYILSAPYALSDETTHTEDKSYEKSITAFDNLSTSKYAKTYVLKSSGTTIPYTSKNLSTRGTVTYGKSSSAYISNKSDELYVFDVGQKNGKYWAYVSYPISSSKRAYAYIPLSAITANNGSHVKKTSKGKFYCSIRSGSSTNSSYYVAKKDVVYLIATSGSKYQIMYPMASGKYRIAWCSKTDYNKYC